MLVLPGDNRAFALTGQNSADRSRLRDSRLALNSTSSFASPRRMPPLPEIHSSPRRALPLRSSELARREEPTTPTRSAIPEEDRQTRQVRTRSEDAPVTSPPQLAVAEKAPGQLRPAPIEDAPRPVVEPPSKPVELPDVVDAPPSIESPPVTETNRPAKPPVVTDPDTGGDPVLAGRPRMVRRDDLPPGVPPPSFPRTYYGETAPAPKIAAVPKDERWTWKPKLFRRFRM